MTVDSAPAVQQAQQVQRRSGGWVATLVVGTVLLIALLVGLAITLLSIHVDNQKEAAGKAATAAAVADIPKLASFSYATVAADQARAKTVLTPSLKKQFDTIFAPLLSTLQQRKVTVTIKTDEAQAIHIDSSTSVRVLIFFDQQTSTPESATPTLTTNAYALTMNKIGSVWLIGAANPAG